MESFIRFYDQDHHYWGVDRYPDWVADDGSFVPFPGSPAWDDFINNYQFSKTGPMKKIRDYSFNMVNL